MRHPAGIAWLIGALALSTRAAAAPGTGCVHDFSAGVDCSESDVFVQSIQIVQLLEDCVPGQFGSAEAVLKVSVSAGAFSRSDPGLFLALNGGSALSGGNCLHDYLEPPLTTSPSYTDLDQNGRPELNQGPWWNAEPSDFQDQCGDIASNTDVVKTLTLRFACADSNTNGIVDLSTCVSWSAGTMSRCQGLNDAFPPTSPRCDCRVVDSGLAMPGNGGRVAGLTLARGPGSDVQLSWGASCTANDNDYAVYEGALGSFTSHQSVVCSTSGATSATFAPDAGNRYFLVVPRNPSREGSYGRTSTGAERPAATSACGVQQLPIACL